MKTYFLPQFHRNFRIALAVASIEVFPPSVDEDKECTHKELIDFLDMYICGGEL